MTRLLPVGVQSIEQIVAENRIYIDKTKLIYELIQGIGYYFLTRPRRFGKTLLLDTLKAIFQGKKELFDKFYIGKTNYKWEKHPVISFDFGTMDSTHPQNLETAIKATLFAKGQSYGVDFPNNIDSSLQGQLSYLINHLSRENKVVVLIDEYDKPITENLSHPNIAEANRDVLSQFFATLKGLYADLQFVFITGVSRFSQASLFSGLNNVVDLTMKPEYATLLGYTETEMRFSFSEYIKIIAEARSQRGVIETEEQVLDEMRKWYNGYRFSEVGDAVYNPHSILNFLDNRKARGYWSETGNTSSLIKHIAEQPLQIVEWTTTGISQRDLLNIQNLKNINLQSLLWQTGYLTLRSYYEKGDLFYLDFPNQEVRESFFYSLIVQFEIKSSVVTSQREKCKEDLAEKRLEDFFETANAFFAKVPEYLWKEVGEGFYHVLLIMLLESIGIKVAAGSPTHTGGISLVVEMPHIIYIMECKQDADVTLSHMELKKYPERYLQADKEIVTIGVNFSSHLHSISNWKAITYLPSGEKVEVIEQVLEEPKPEVWI